MLVPKDLIPSMQPWKKAHIMGSEAEFNYPPLKSALSATSSAAKKKYMCAVAATYVLLFLAAITPPLLQTVSQLQSKYVALAAVLLLTVASILQITGIANKQERNWCMAREALEKVKSASWAFAVGGDPFSLNSENVRESYIKYLESVLEDIESIECGVDQEGLETIPPTMLQLRMSSRKNRLNTYISLRVGDQIKWYCKESKIKKKRYRCFNIFVGVLGVGAIILGLLWVSGVTNFDFMGPFAVGTSGLVGWVQLNKYDDFSKLYAHTSHRLRLAAGECAKINSEIEWRKFVGNIESILDQEHSIWQHNIS